MSNSTQYIIRHLHGIKTMQEIANKAGLMASIKAVQAWQYKRLLLSHREMYQQKRFEPAIEFFFSELYGLNNVNQNNQYIARIVPKLSKILPEEILKLLTSTLQLNALSFELDFTLAKKLGDIEINHDTYAQAYRSCQNLTTRQQQISSISTLGKDLAVVAKMKSLSSLLFITRKPAKFAGVLALHEFLENVLNTFKNIENMDDFITPILNKKQQIMRQLIAPSPPTPFTNV